MTEEIEMNEFTPPKELTIPDLGAEQRRLRRASQAGNLPQLKLMISTPYYLQMAFARYADSLIETARYLELAGVPWEKHSIMGDSYIDRAKNSIIADFLESDCTDLLMIDSDMSFPPDAVGRMLRHPQSVVGGFFPMKGAYGTFAGHLKRGPAGESFDVSTAIDLWDGSALLEAHLMPGGFLRLKRDVLERFADHYPDCVYQDSMANMSKPDRVYTAFFQCYIHDHQRYGEDAHFCKLLREMDEQIWCDPNISFGHTGMKTYEGNFHVSLLKPEEELEAIRQERANLADAITATRIEPEEAAQ